jgi:hypothetical protein
VASGDFANPCTPQTPATNAFFSGFMPTDKQGQLTYTIPIRDTNPIWFYCSQARHCQDGMVGVINPCVLNPPLPNPTLTCCENSPASGQTLTDYTTRAATAANNVSPQAPGSPAAGGGQIGGSTTAPAAAPAASTTRSAGSTVVRSSWGLVCAAVAAMVVL